VSLTGFDTEQFVVYPNGNNLRIESLDGPFSFAVPAQLGFMVVTVEDASSTSPATIGSNYLLGSEVVVNYDLGYAYSVDALPFQGGINDGDRVYRFDGVEYASLPRRVAVEFTAPDGSGSELAASPVTAELALFTPAFGYGMAPRTLCSISAFDAREQMISGSLEFGCWGLFDLTDFPELAYPELGDAGSHDVHGWLTLSCSVQTTGPGSATVLGGVDGALIQTVGAGGKIDRNGSPTLAGGAAWSRQLFQSTGVSSGVALELTGGFTF
jgi:hypothetical protein